MWMKIEYYLDGSVCETRCIQTLPAQLHMLWVAGDSECVSPFSGHPKLAFQCDEL